jgi:hypothetical protein
MAKCYTSTRKYRSSEGESSVITDILPKKLTLYPELHPVIWRDVKDNELKTIFKEVEVMPFDEANPHSRDMLKSLENIKPEKVPEKEYARIMWDTFRKSMHDLWKSGHKHFVFASSGYDSRLMSLALKSLSEEHGADWLGNMAFIEADGESAQYRKNMELIGWGGARCLVYNEGAPVHEYHKRSFDFDTAWEKLGGMCGYPVSFNWEGQQWFQDLGIIPLNGNKTQILWGYFSNEVATTMRKGKTLYQYFKGAYRGGLSNPRSKIVGTGTPFQHFDMMTNVLKYGREHIVARTGLSKTILKHIAPGPIADIPSPIHRTKNTTVRKLSNRLVTHTLSDYNSSWFGQKFPKVQPQNIIQYDPWWGHWCVASFCEHLLRQGHQLTVG